MSPPPARRKLIEVALPLEAINRAAAREKSIRVGHPSTLHLWWSRKPLAACRAVIFAQLVDDPSSDSVRFPTEESQDLERQRLFRIIEELVKWESSTDSLVLGAARAEIARCLGGKQPRLLDPFCGGGSIPLEAQRLGLEAHGSDLNPVAVLITKALIEIPPRWAARPPVHRTEPGRAEIGLNTWRDSQGLADDVRHYGAWMRKEAEKRIGHLYPKAVLPDGSTAPVIAWLWARTVTCPNPVCRGKMPLVSSFWLGKKKGKESWVRPMADTESKVVHFEIGHGAIGPEVGGTVGRSGAICLICKFPVKLAHIRSEGQAGRMGVQLMAIVAEGNRSRTYLPPAAMHAAAAEIDRPDNVPDTAIPHNPRYLTTPNYGMTKHSDLFTNRQLVGLCTFSDLVREARDEIIQDAREAGYLESEGEAYADAICLYLAFMVDRIANESSSICTWAFDPGKEHVRSTFTLQAIPMVWGFAESSPFCDSTGGFGPCINRVADVVARLGGTPAVVEQANAAAREFDEFVVSTDPPYFDNISYGDIADFFYVWLRRSLLPRYATLLSTILTPKADELVVNPYLFAGDAGRAEQHFEDGLAETFSRIASQYSTDLPLTLYYAFKQSEDEDAGGSQVSTGWEKMLEGLLKANLMITGTWPLRTERKGRSREHASNALASSIVLVCRRRPVGASISDRPGFMRCLKDELGSALRDLQKGAISPVDLDQAAIGPGMAVFSRYAKIVESSGEPMRVRTALALINQVKDEVLSAQEGDFDAETRWAIRWFELRGFDEGPFGEAEQLSKSRNTSLVGLQQHGIAIARGGSVWLIPRSQLPASWDPTTDAKVSVWEACQHLVKALDESGERATAELLAKLGHYGETAKELAYRLFDICVKTGRTQEAQVYNALVTSWLEITRLVASGPSTTAGQLF